MSYSLFADKEHRPTEDEIQAALGVMQDAWRELTRHIEERYRVQRDFGFYGKNYGWAVRYRMGSKALASLYPGLGCFTVQVVLGAPAVAQALASDPPESIRTAIERATPYPEGRWLFIPVAADEDLPAIEHLLAVKARPAEKAAPQHAQ